MGLHVALLDHMATMAITTVDDKLSHTLRQAVSTNIFLRAHTILRF